MDPATVGVITTVAPLVIKCGELIFRRYAPGVVASVTEEGCAAVGRKAGGDGILGRIGECSGRAIGWVAGLFVSQSDSVKNAVDAGAGLMSSEAKKALLGVAGKAAEHVANKVVDRCTAKSVTIEGEDVELEHKIKKQMFKALKQKKCNKEIKGQILLADLELKRMEVEAKRMEFMEKHSSFMSPEQHKALIEQRRAAFESMLSLEVKALDVVEANPVVE